MKKIAIVLGVALGALFFFSSSVHADECESECSTPTSTADFGGGRQISGAIDKSGSRVFFDNDNIVFIPVALPQSIANWAQIKGLISFPINRLSLVKIVKRYELAKMLVAFHKNVKMKTITYRDVCEYHHFNDYRGFNLEMQGVITDICSLGVMGWGLDRNMNDIVLPAFRPLDMLTASEMVLAFHRYFGRRSDMPRSLTRADILRFLYNHR